MQYTIESRPLTGEYTHRAAVEAEPKQTTIEAANADDAISKFLRQRAAELVSLTKPIKGRESIATVKKNEYVFLVRVYAA